MNNGLTFSTLCWLLCIVDANKIARRNDLNWIVTNSWLQTSYEFLTRSESKILANYETHGLNCQLHQPGSGMRHSLVTNTQKKQFINHHGKKHSFLAPPNEKTSKNNQTIQKQQQQRIWSTQIVCRFKLFSKLFTKDEALAVQERADRTYLSHLVALLHG